MERDPVTTVCDSAVSLEPGPSKKVPKLTIRKKYACETSHSCELEDVDTFQKIPPLTIKLVEYERCMQNTLFCESTQDIYEDDDDDTEAEGDSCKKRET